ncbi:hypothetical protein HMPREF1097_02733 [Enterocloster bolteae 90B8]|uniref:Uncharacterized protein n=1 Tax=Enterocloster bolteae 90B8 TaxID=997897 RepID=R0B1M0_9FIRM|nr:hypothetical protein HMPREF1097_02733 [Enterocloster bolteae 90B8]
MLTKEQENILRFLLSLPRDTNNRITVSRKNYNLDYSLKRINRQSDISNKLIVVMTAEIRVSVAMTVCTTHPYLYIQSRNLSIFISFL